jgi:ribonuclease VapC
MVVDSSALLAVFFGEPGARELEARLLAEPQPRISAGSLLEAAIVVEARKGQSGGKELDLFLQRLNVVTEVVDAEQVVTARAGFRKYGKGRHEAGLNYGDCFAYALAVTLDEPLLFKGNDFARTDVRNAQDEH